MSPVRHSLGDGGDTQSLLVLRPLRTHVPQYPLGGSSSLTKEDTPASLYTLPQLWSFSLAYAGNVIQHMTRKVATTLPKDAPVTLFMHF